MVCVGWKEKKKGSGEILPWFDYEDIYWKMYGGWGMIVCIIKKKKYIYILMTDYKRKRLEGKQKKMHANW